MTKSDWKSFQRDYKIINFETDLTKIFPDIVNFFESLGTLFMKLKTVFIIVETKKHILVFILQTVLWEFPREYIHPYNWLEAFHFSQFEISCDLHYRQR